MNKPELKSALEKSYHNFIRYTDDLTTDEYEFAPQNKWNAGQQALHLIKCTSPVLFGLSLPKIILKIKYGKTVHPSKNYDELVKFYKEQLEFTDSASPKRYSPKQVKAAAREKISQQLGYNIELLCDKIDKWSEKDLDNYILPHPLLGKLTIREMLYFTIYHARHHQILVKQYLKGI